MRDQIRIVLMQLERVVLGLSNQIKAIDGDSVPEDLATRAVYTSECCKVLVTAWGFTPEERGAVMIEAGWPRDEVQAMVDLLLAHDKFTAVVKKEKPTLN